jgi:hypothetical protein
MEIGVMPCGFSVLVHQRGAGWLLASLSGGSPRWRSDVGSRADGVLLNKRFCNPDSAGEVAGLLHTGHRGGGQDGCWQSVLRYGSGKQGNLEFASLEID